MEKQNFISIEQMEERLEASKDDGDNGSGKETPTQTSSQECKCPKGSNLPPKGPTIIGPGTDYIVKQAISDILKPTQDTIKPIQDTIITMPDTTITPRDTIVTIPPQSDFLSTTTVFNQW